MMQDHIVIGLCTFRRPMVEATLLSLFGQRLPLGLSVEIIVADNDDARSAEALIRSLSREAPFGVTYLHAPACNISIARNAILDAANATGAKWLAFVDDDERLDAGWIEALWRQAAAIGAGVVLGDVRAHYGPKAPDWMRRGAVHDTRPERDAKGQIKGGYTCNVLMNMTDPALVGLRFDLSRGQSGGEDTAFFAMARERGAIFAHAPDALADEDVPDNRATLQWLLRRRMRMGQTHASLIGAQAGVVKRAKLAAIAAAKLAACGAMAVASPTDPLARNRALMRGALHFGTVSGLLGVRALILYGRPTVAPVVTGQSVREPAK
jgi:succinoglycan biosynthesis protein ExoM